MREDDVLSLVGFMEDEGATAGITAVALVEIMELWNGHVFSGA